MFGAKCEYEIEPVNCVQYKCKLKVPLKDAAVQASLARTGHATRAQGVFQHGFVPVPKHLYNLFNMGIKPLLKLISKETEPPLEITSHEIKEATYRKEKDKWLIELVIEGGYKLRS